MQWLRLVVLPLRHVASNRASARASSAWPRRGRCLARSCEFGIASRDAPAAQTAIRYWYRYSLPTPRSQLTFWKADFLETLPMCRARHPPTGVRTPHIKLDTSYQIPWTPHDHLFCALRRACFSSKAIGSLQLRPLQSAAAHADDVHQGRAAAVAVRAAVPPLRSHHVQCPVRLRLARPEQPLVRENEVQGGAAIDFQNGDRFVTGVVVSGCESPPAGLQAPSLAFENTTLRY